MSKILVIIGIVLSFTLFDGIEVEGRIFLGKPDAKRLIKHHVAILLHKGPSIEPEYLCGGGILTKEYIITAAHCVYGLSALRLIVQSGYFDEKNGEDWRVLHKVTKYMHPALYRNSTGRHYENDIAILRLARPINLSDESLYQKLQLPEYDNDYEDVPVLFAGYGAVKYFEIFNKTSNKTRLEFEYTKNLHFFESKVIPLEECRQLMPFLLNDDSICTQPDNDSGFSCLKDGGGALVHNGIVIGIRNKILECDEEAPELFTRVSSHLSFIYNVLKQKASLDIKYVKN